MKYRVRTSCLENLDYNEVIREDDNGNFIGETNQAKYNKGVIERNPDWFQPIEQVKVGDYWQYKGSGKILRVNAKEKTVDDYRIDGTRINATANKEIYPYESNLVRNARKLSTHEIEEALDQERKRRGFKDGTVYDPSDLNPCYSDKNKIKARGHDFQYDKYDDRLHVNGYGVYENGNWAEIVDQTPHIEINGYEAEFHEEYVKFGCAKISKRIFQELHYANNQCGGELFRTGFGGNRAVQGIKIGDAIFRTDQINEIAEYYDS